VYTASFPVKARLLSGMDSPLFPSGGELDLELGSHHYKNYIEIDAGCRLCRNQEELSACQHSLDSLDRRLRGRDLPVYGDGLQVRDWLHVNDHCRAIETVLERGRPGEIYNVGGSNERTNLEIIRLIFQELEAPEFPEDMEILHIYQVGRIHTVIVRGTAEEATNRLAVYSPVLLEALPLSLEEIFIYELGGADYAVKDIVL